MRTAKEFYYDYYKQDQEFQSIHSRIDLSRIDKIHPSFKNNQEIKKIANFKPTFSNDYRLEVLFRDVLESCNDDLKSKLNNIFIATYYDLNLQAYINEYPGEYEGNIIFFNYGLTNAIIEYSILLALYYEYALIPPNKRKEKKKILIYHANKLAKEQVNWRKTGLCDLKEFKSSFYKLSTRIVNNHVAPYAAATKFILCHEIAHSLLEHMYRENKFFYEYFGITFRDILTSSENHQNEFQADIFSLLMSSGAFKESNTRINNGFRFNLEQAIGSLLVLTVLGQQTEDQSINTDSHPSLYNRFGIMVNTLRSLMDVEIFQASFGLIIDYQGMLYRTQGVGLGKNVPKDYNLLEL